MIANPRTVREFARALGKQVKTDPIDAWVLATFGARMAPPPRPLPTANERRLEALIARRADVVTTKVQDAHRQGPLPSFLHPSSARIIARCVSEIAILNAEIADTVAADPALRATVARWRTVPGIGPVVGPMLAARLPERARLTGKQLAALVGVAPSDRQRGTRRGQAFVRGGRADLRAALYLGVLRATQCDPVIAARYRHLIDDLGKAPKQAIVRWRLGVMHAMLRDKLSWSETTIVTSFVKEKGMTTTSDSKS